MCCVVRRANYSLWQAWVFAKRTHIYVFLHLVRPWLGNALNGCSARPFFRKRKLISNAHFCEWERGSKSFSDADTSSLNKKIWDDRKAYALMKIFPHNIFSRHQTQRISTCMTLFWKSHSRRSIKNKFEATKKKQVIAEHEQWLDANDTRA